MTWVLVAAVLLQLATLVYFVVRYRRFKAYFGQQMIKAADQITYHVTEKIQWRQKYEDLAATDVGEWMRKYEALEQGRDEQEENYEQQFLSFQEAIQTLETSRQYLIEYIEEHKEECPIFGNPAPSTIEDVYSSADMDNA